MHILIRLIRNVLIEHCEACPRAQGGGRGGVNEGWCDIGARRKGAGGDTERHFHLTRHLLAVKGGSGGQTGSFTSIFTRITRCSWT